MYSVGQEGVLVVWKLDSMEPRFLPRLGSPLSHIATSQDEKYLAVTCSNNTIQVISTASWSVISQIQGLSSGILIIYM